MQSNIIDSLPQAQKANKVAEAATAQRAQGASPLVIAWVYLLDSVNTQQESARLRSKALRLNSETQEDINNEIGAIKNVWIPRLQKEKKTVHGKTITVNKNESQVAAAQTANEEAAKQRGQLENLVIVLRQQFQTGSTVENTITNGMLESVSEGSEALKILKSVSLKIVNKQNLK